MKRLFLIPLLLSALSINQAKADFGAADLGASGNEYSVFDAWCAKRGNDCKVEFSQEGISVNKGSIVPYQNIIKYSYEVDDKALGDLHIFDIVYTKTSKGRGVGRIIFGNPKVAKNFLSSLKEFTNKNQMGDPRCDSGFRYFKGACLAEGEAVRLEQQEVWRQRDGMGNFANYLQRQEQIRQEERRLDQEDRRIQIEAIDAATPDTVIDLNQNNINQNNLIIR